MKVEEDQERQGEGGKKKRRKCGNYVEKELKEIEMIR